MTTTLLWCQMTTLKLVLLLNQKSSHLYLTPSLCCTTEAIFWRFWKFPVFTEPNSISSSPTLSPCHRNKNSYFLHLNFKEWWSFIEIYSQAQKYSSHYLQLHRQVSLVSQHPLVQMEEEEWPAAPSPPPGLPSHPVAASLSLERAACAGLLLSPPWWPCDRSAGLTERIKASLLKQQ